MHTDSNTYTHKGYGPLTHTHLHKTNTHTNTHPQTNTEHPDIKHTHPNSCLLVESEGFVFLEVNKVWDGQPNIDTPHFCYNLVQLKRKSESEDGLPNANLVVNVEKENTIFYHSSIEVETPSGLARYQETGRHGKTSFSIYENGWYDVTVRAQGYSPAVERVFISCNHTEVCTTQVNLALRYYLIFLKTSHLDSHTTNDVKPEM